MPQTDTTPHPPPSPTFFGVRVDTQLPWKPHIEKMERCSLQTLALMRKLTVTTWGADSSILTKVCTATVRPTMEYISTTWGTAIKTNNSRQDKVQNMALRVILGAKKATSVHEMEKTANVEPLERGCLPNFYTQICTAHQKSPPTPKSEPPVQRTAQETPGHRGFANRATTQILPGGQIGSRTNVSGCPRHHLKGTALCRAQKPHPCPDC